MSHARPEVFVSATTGDLGTCRQIVKEALLTLGCVPVEQTNFPPDARTVVEMLRERIGGCDAVVHLAGLRYGAEPAHREPGAPRRSYTQIEHDVARELGKPVYVFVCGEGFPYDLAVPEDGERVALQQAHRARLASSDRLRTTVVSREDLAAKVHALQTRVEGLGAELARSRRRTVRLLVSAVALLLAVASGLWWLAGRNALTEERILQLETEREHGRAYLLAVIEVYSEQRAHSGSVATNDSDSFDRAMEVVAVRRGLVVEDVRRAIARFAADVRADNSADWIDRALTQYADGNFVAAATSAHGAANEARQRRLAAESAASNASQYALDERRNERRALTLQADAVRRLGRHGEAISSYEEALILAEQGTPAWGLLFAKIAQTASIWAGTSTGPEELARYRMSVDASQSALSVLSARDHPGAWAASHALLALGLRKTYRSASPREHVALIERAIASYRAILTVQHGLQLQGLTYYGLGEALLERAAAADVIERAPLQDEAIAALREALPELSEPGSRVLWAWAQHSLGEGLRDRANLRSGDDRMLGLAEAAMAYRAALSFFSASTFSKEWLLIQGDLVQVLRDRAEGTLPGQEALFEEAAAAYRELFVYFTRQGEPRLWALEQALFANTLYSQATLSPPQGRRVLLQEALAAAQAALEVGTAEQSSEAIAVAKGLIPLLVHDLATDAAK